MHWLNLVPNVLLGIALIGLVVFAFTYSKFADWRSTPPGRGLMYMIASMSAVLMMAFTHLITGPYVGMDIVRMAVYGALTGSVWNMVRVLYNELKLDPLRRGWKLWNVLFRSAKKGKAID